jgi:hypothetical protein
LEQYHFKITTDENRKIWSIAGMGRRLGQPKDNHRHVSHLYGLFPSNQINPFTTPELLDASKTVLLHRGDVSTGWSMGWKVNLGQIIRRKSRQ